MSECLSLTPATTTAAVPVWLTHAVQRNKADLVVEVELVCVTFVEDHLKQERHRVHVYAFQLSRLEPATLVGVK